MAIEPTGLRRAVALLKIPDAIARGLSVEGFIRELKEVGQSYKRTTMLADWRTVAGIKAKEDLVKYVRKDRIPSTGVIADVEWSLSEEYMYKVKTWSRLRPDEPLTERFVTVLSDILKTSAEIEQQVYSQWGEWERYPTEELERLQVTSIYHRIPSPLEED